MEPHELLERVHRRAFRVGVVGLGRVGLPLALAYAAQGISAIGVDLDEERLRSIDRGVMPFTETGADQILSQVRAEHTLEVSRDYRTLAAADAIFVTIGAQLGNEFRADYSHLRNALSALGGVLRPVQILMLRGTVAPGTLVNVVKPFVERASGLRVGESLLLASTPERIASGRAFRELPVLPEIVGGIDALSSQVAAAVLGSLSPSKKVFITTAKGAELAKLFTNVYRYVTFALANEFALLAELHGENAHTIIRLANEDYPRGGIPRPGPCGGPCLSKDGYFLVEDLVFPDFILLAWKLNEGVPAHIVRRLKRRLEMREQRLSGAKVCVLGMGFKADNDDMRQSPALRIIDLLKAEGAAVTACDPFHDTPDPRQAIAGADAIVLATNHTAFRDLAFLDQLEKTTPPPILVDCWSEWDADEAEAAGADLLVFGKGDSA